jgi:hypothetical protein
MTSATSENLKLTPAGSFKDVAERPDYAVAKQQTLNDLAANKPLIIKQPERLFTVRPRSDIHRASTDRGQISALRIIPDNRFRKSSTLVTLDPAIEAVRRKLIGPQGSFGYTGFLLQALQIGFSEKLQVVHTFGDTEVVYYFGRMPTQANVTGVVTDDADNQWFTKFIDVYNLYLRGTQLARNFELVQLQTPNSTITGTITNMSYNQDASSDTNIVFNMSLLVKQYTTLTVQEAFAANFPEGLQKLPWIFPGNNVTKYPAEFYDSGLYATPNGEEPTLYLGTEDDTGGVLAVKPNVFDSIQKVNNLILETAAAGQRTIENLTKPATDLLTFTGNLSDGVVSLLNAVAIADQTLLNAIMSPFKQFEMASRQLKNAQGVITSFPRTAAERLAITLGERDRTPRFLGGSSMSGEQASAILVTANPPSVVRAPVVGPPSTFSEDDVAVLSI